MSQDVPRDAAKDDLNVPSIDPEELAALLDGRLDASKRERVLAALSSSPELLELYADIVAVSQDTNSLELVAGAPLATPSRGAPSRSRPWASRLIPFAAAAMVLIAIGVQWRREIVSKPTLGTPAEIVALLRPLASPRELPNAFEATRGSGENSTPIGAAIRIGVDIATSTAWAASADSVPIAAMRDALNRVAEGLSNVPAGAIAAQTFRELARRPVDDSLSLLLAHASTTAEQFVDSRSMRVGAWLTAVRIAAAQRDTMFARSPKQHAGLLEVRRLSPNDTVVSKSVSELERLMAAHNVDWPNVDSQSAMLLRRLGRL